MPELRDPRALPLRWGGYRARLLGGGWLIIGGGVAIAGSNDVTLLLLLAGTVAQVAGWAILPCDGWRRLTAVFPATLGTWLLLTGPSFIGVLVLPYLGWLLCRHRPVVTWLSALLVIGAAVVVERATDGYAGMAVALPAMIAVMAGAALLTRLLDRSQRNTRRRPVVAP